MIADFIKVAKNIKLKAYHQFVLFILLFIVPGTLIMFYFFKNLFENCDLIKVLFLVISISASVVFLPYFVILQLLVILSIKYNKPLILKNENLLIETSFYHSTMISLGCCFFTLFVMYLCNTHKIGYFIFIYTILSIIFSLALAYIYKLIFKETAGHTNKKKKRKLQQNKKL